MSASEEERDQPRLAILCQHLLDETLTDEERVELRTLLAADPDGADRFIGLMAMHALLRKTLSDYRPPTLFESLFGASPDLAVPETPGPDKARRSVLPAHPDAGYLGGLWGTFRSAMNVPLAASLVTCTLVVCGLILVMAFIPAGAAPVSKSTFAMITAAKDCTWLSSNLPTYESARLSRGVLQLRKGNVELEFQSGTHVILQAPVDFELVSADRCFIHIGQAVVKSPPGPGGFTVGTPVAEIVNLASELGVNVGDDRETLVHCFDGQVEVKPNSLLAPSAKPQKLTAGSSCTIVCDGSPQAPSKITPDQFVRILQTPDSKPEIDLPDERIEVVNVDFGPGGNSVYSGPGALQAGLGNHWNTITELGRESEPLLSRQQRPTTITIVVDAQLMFTTSYSHSGNALQDDYCFVRDPGAAGRFFIRGLVPNARYNLYLYGTTGISTAKPDQVAYGAPEGSVFTIGEDSKATAGLRDGDRPFSPGKDHVVFAQIKAGSAGEIRGIWTNNAQSNAPFNTNPFGPFNGLQIVGPLSSAEGR